MTIAYLLKGFPVLSETFISSEVHRLEKAGVPLRLFVVKPRDEREHHPVIDRIKACPHYLPATTRISESSRLRWLAGNVPRFMPSIGRVVRRRPRGVFAATRMALAESVLTRRSFWSWPKISYIRDLLVALALADEVLRDPDIRHLHAHFAHDSTTVTWLASMVTGLPFSFTAHAKDIYKTQLNPRNLLRRKVDAAEFVVTCTEANRRYLQSLGSRTPVHRMYHGLNDDFHGMIADAGVAERPDEETFRLLAVGRLVRKKGFDVLVEACGILRQRGVPVDAVIIGEDDDVGDAGSFGDDLRRRISRLGLEHRVHMPGQLGQADVFAKYRSANVLCLPCRVLENGDRDGIPNVLLEAMACGVPVVTTPVSGIPELVDNGTNGLLVAPDDPGELAAAIQLLHDDRDLANKLSQGGTETIRDRFDGDLLAQRLASLFDRVVA